MKQKTIKHFLKSKLTRKEYLTLRRAFDIIGGIAIIEVPKGLVKKEKSISNAILALNKQIRTVVKKKGGHYGRRRLQKFIHLAGEKKKETITVENGIRLKLNIEKTYYSPRMSSERKRIYRQVARNEDVLVMFSGIGPYTIEIAKHTCAKSVYGIELNHTAHDYAVENTSINKITNVELYCGDVRDVLPRLRKKFDRIVMPLPKGAENYLDLALRYIKRKGIIHYYDFLEEKDIPAIALRKIDRACKELNKKYKILKVVKCGQLAPRAYRICVDFRVV
jgi:tRNA (guanine37-N1)-methyltransferase